MDLEQLKMVTEAWLLMKDRSSLLCLMKSEFYARVRVRDEPCRSLHANIFVTVLRPLLHNVMWCHLEGFCGKAYQMLSSPKMGMHVLRFTVEKNKSKNVQFFVFSFVSIHIHIKILIKCF